MKNNQKAFSRPHSIDKEGDYPVHHNAQEGMDLRDWFAGKALSTITRVDHSKMFLTPDYIAVTAYAIADAMMEARKK